MKVFVARRCGQKERKREKEGESNDTCDVKASQVGTQMSSYQKKQGPACPHDPATCTLITEPTTTVQALKGRKKSFAFFRLLEHAANDLHQRCRSMADTSCVKCCVMQQEKREGGRFKPLQAQSVDLFKVT